MSGIRALIAAAVLSAGLLFASPAQADCADPAAVAGVMVYNADHKVMQYCNGTVWIAMDRSKSMCIAPDDCPNAGDVCDDGNAGNDPDPVFAGFMFYGSTKTCEPLYVTQSDQSGPGLEWKTSNDSGDLSPSLYDDGRANSNQIPNSTTFPAFKECKDLSYGGFTDWYLPSWEEWHLLWKNRASISGGFPENRYWTSTEGPSGSAWRLRPESQGALDRNSKTGNGMAVRCVRRD